MQQHIQCLLGRGAARQTAWIPERFATDGRVVRLHDDDGWTVLHAFREETRDSSAFETLGDEWCATEAICEMQVRWDRDAAEAERL